MKTYTHTSALQIWLDTPGLYEKKMCFDWFIFFLLLIALFHFSTGYNCYRSCLCLLSGFQIWRPDSGSHSSRVTVFLTTTWLCFVYSSLYCIIIVLNRVLKVGLINSLPLVPSCRFPRPRLPALHTIPDIAGDTVAITFVGYAVSVSLAMIYADKHGYSIHPNQVKLYETPWN